MATDRWQVIRTGTIDGDTVEMRYAEFGTGRAKLRNWKIFRDGNDVGYAVNQGDADANFARVMSGLALDRETGRYEPYKKA